MLSIDTASVAVLEGLKWRTFSGVGQAISLPGANPGGEVGIKEGEEEEEGEAELVR